MHTTAELLDLAEARLAARYDLGKTVSDYRLAKLWKLRVQTISNWRTGRSVPDAQYVPLFADACELPAEYVYVCFEAERAELPEIKGILRRIASKYLPVAASVLLATGGAERAANVMIADAASAPVSVAGEL